LFNSFDAPPNGRAQLFAQEQLRLTKDARQRIIYFMANVRY
jgi:hypothetical protein